MPKPELQEFWDLEHELIEHVADAWAKGLAQDVIDPSMTSVWVRSFTERVFTLGSRVVESGLAQDLKDNNPSLGAELFEFLGDDDA